MSRQNESHQQLLRIGAYANGLPEEWLKFSKEVQLHLAKIGCQGMHNDVQKMNDLYNLTDLQDKEGISRSVINNLKNILERLHDYTDRTLLPTQPTTLDGLTRYYNTLEELLMVWSNYRHLYERDYIQFEYLQRPERKILPHPSVAFYILFPENLNEP